jgi:aldehyde:ferredoxin oxidoreductase
VISFKKKEQTMNKILRIDMSKPEVKEEAVCGELLELGGRALSSHILHSEVPPTCHPLGDANKLILAPGLLAGTAAPNSGRLSIGAKSPLTKGVKEANVGGTVGQKLARMGIKALVLENRPAEDTVYIVRLDQNGPSISPAPEVAGLTNYQTSAKLIEQYGDNVGIVCIGPAGEMKLAASSVAVTDPDGRPSRHAARGGLGAVMGSKNVKAVIVDDTGTEPRRPVDKETFREAVKAFTEKIMARKPTGLLAQFGTVGGLTYLSKVGAVPTRNFTAGSFEGSEKIGGKAVAALNAARGGSFGHVCMPGCVVRCSNVMHDKDGKFLTAGFEYESTAMLGANLGIDDLDTVMVLEKMCDDLGLDTMEIGVAMGVAHDAGLFSFGDGKRAIELVREIGEGTVLGRVLGQGAEVTARVFGISRVPVVKGQGIPAHDPRREIGTGIGYASSPQGADHTGLVTLNVESTGELIEIIRKKQITTSAYDSMGFCQFVEADTEIMAKLAGSFFGRQWSPDDVAAMGKAVLEKETAFNRDAGLGPATDRLPEFMSKEPLSPHQGVFDVPDEELEKI